MNELRCGRCGLSKHPSEFAWRRVHKGQRDSYCRSCRAAYKQEHYAKNRQRYIDQARERNRRVIRERGRFLLRYFEDHPCADCGETDPIVLEFDHLGSKSFAISHGIRYRSWQALWDELAKCEVVCVNCHRRRTAKRSGFARYVQRFESG